MTFTTRLVRRIGWIGLIPLLASACEPVVTADSEQACAITAEATVPVTVSRGVPIVDASVNGTPVKMVVDTGAATSTLFDDTAKRVGAQTDWAWTEQRPNATGAVVRHPVTVDQLELGQIASGKTEMAAAPQPIALRDVADGLIGNDFMRRYDVDFDLPHKQITLYHWRNCPHGEPNWTGPYATVAPIASRGQFVVRGALSGRPVSILIDSGTALGSVLEETAFRYGVSQAELDKAPKATISGLGGTMPAPVYRFASLNVGTVRMVPFLAAVFDVVSREADVIVGNSLFATHRVWISQVSNRIYIAKP